MSFFSKIWKTARVYYTLSISRGGGGGGGQAPGPPGFATVIMLIYLTAILISQDILTNNTVFMF